MASDDDNSSPHEGELCSHAIFQFQGLSKEKWALSWS